MLEPAGHEPDIRTRISADEPGVLTEALRRNAPIFIADTRHSHRFPPDRDWPNTRSRMILPIRLGDRLLGLLDLHSHEATQRTRQELVGLQSLADLPSLGPPGREVSRRHIDDLDVTIVRFDNGSTLVFKQTDYEKGSVSVQLRFGTGLSGLPANRPSLTWMASVLASTGVGPLDLDGLLVPRGSMIIFSIIALHERADIHEDPMSFRPERFLDQRPGTYTWLPFGGGPHRCLGGAFAMFEMRVLMRTLLQQRRVEPGPRPRLPRPEINPMLVPPHGAPVVLSERS